MFRRSKTIQSIPKQSNPMIRLTGMSKVALLWKSNWYRLLVSWRTRTWVTDWLNQIVIVYFAFLFSLGRTRKFPFYNYHWFSKNKSLSDIYFDRWARFENIHGNNSIRTAGNKPWRIYYREKMTSDFDMKELTCWSWIMSYVNWNEGEKRSLAKLIWEFLEK